MIYILTLFISIIVLACSSNFKEKPENSAVISIDLDTPADSICLLSNIADSIEYYPIHLKGLDKKCNIELLSDYIWVNHRTDSVRGSLFSRTYGTVIGEKTFSALLQEGGFVLNDEVSTFFRLENEKSLVCPASEIRGTERHWLSVSVDAVTGEHTDTIAFPFDNGVEYFRLDDRYVLRKHRIIGDDILPSFKLDWYTADLDFIKQDVLPDTVFQTFLLWNQTKVHLLKDKVYFHFPTMRTIYRVSAEHAPVPLYRYEVGNHRHDYSQIKDVAQYWEAERKGQLSCYAIRTSLIAENYIFGGFNYKGMIHWVLFDRNTHQTWIIPTQSMADYHSLEGIKNDLDGGFDFWPRRVSKNGEIYTWYTVEELKAKVAQSHTGQMKNPDAAEQLKEMLDNLPEDVNVIVAVLKEKRQHTVPKETDKDLERIENYSLDVTEDCIQIYENSNCRATAAKIEGVDYMIAYSAPLHCIDLIALNGTPSFRQIKLETQGPDGVNDVSGIFYYDDTFVIRMAGGFCRVNLEGKVVSKWNLNDYLGKNKGFGLRFPEQTVAFNVFSTLGFDDQKGLVALPLYQYEKVNGQYPARILVLSCKDWQIVEELDVTYPDKLKQEAWLGCLGIIQALPQGDKVIYNFPASSDIFVYDRTTKSTQVHSIATRYTENYYRCKDEQDPGFGGGYFLPLRYDHRHQCYWRVQQRKIDDGGVSGKPFSVTRLTPDFELVGEYDMPTKKKISSYTILFTDDKVLFPYLGGEHIGENNIAFYGFKF